MVARKVSRQEICASGKHLKGVCKPGKHLNAVQKKYERKEYQSVSNCLKDPDTCFVRYKGQRCPPTNKETLSMAMTTVMGMGMGTGTGTGLVPQEFCLCSFKEKNFTYGIPYYDAAEGSDPLLCKDYVTDMFQWFFHAKVSSDE